MGPHNSLIVKPIHSHNPQAPGKSSERVIERKKEFSMSSQLGDKAMEALADKAASSDMDLGMVTPASIFQKAPPVSGVKVEVPSLAELREVQVKVKSAQLNGHSVFYVC